MDRYNIILQQDINNIEHTSEMYVKYILYYFTSKLIKNYLYN